MEARLLSRLGAELGTDEHVGVAVAIVSNVAVSYFDECYAVVVFPLVRVVVPDVVEQSVCDLLLPDSCYCLFGVAQSYLQTVIFLVLDPLMFIADLYELFIFLERASHQRLVGGQIIQRILLVLCFFEPEVTVYS